MKTFANHKVIVVPDVRTTRGVEPFYYTFAVIYQFDYFTDEKLAT